MMPFIEGKVDMAIVTVYNEALALKAARCHARGGHFNPADMGVNLPNESHHRQRARRERKAEVGAGLPECELRGWAYALRIPTRPSTSWSRPRRTSIARSRRSSWTNSFRSSSMAMPRRKASATSIRLQLEYTNRFLLEHGVLKSPVDLKAAVDTSFWDNVPATDKVIKAGS